jgi:hypothetical protein
MQHAFEEELGGVKHGFQIFRGLNDIDFAGTDVIEIILGEDPAGVTPTPAARVAYEVVSLVALRRPGCETEAR